jgi:hypothetical protein
MEQKFQGLKISETKELKSNMNSARGSNLDRPVAKLCRENADTSNNKVCDSYFNHCVSKG